MNIATWNIRHFGENPRLPAAIHFIAEICDQFDLIAITELRENLSDLERVMQLLGPYWKAVFSDAIPDAGGNRERIGILYDGRAVRFTGLAAEADPPRRKIALSDGSGDRDWVRPFEWWRSPYMASFRAGNFDFVLVIAHIRWGDSVRERNKELQGLAEWVHMRRANPHAVDRDMIVLGDFNITTRRSSTFKAIRDFGLEVAPGLAKREFGSNLAKDKRYDQILHYPLHDSLYLDRQGNYSAPAGLLDFFMGDHAPLFPGRNLSKSKFTFQLSDHLPLWMQLNIWNDDLVLDQILADKT